MDSLNSVIRICGVAFLRPWGFVLPGVDPAFPPLLAILEFSHARQFTSKLFKGVSLANNHNTSSSQTTQSFRLKIPPHGSRNKPCGLSRSGYSPWYPGACGLVRVRTRGNKLTLTNGLVAMLVAMLSTWAADGKPIYSTMTDGLKIP